MATLIDTTYVKKYFPLYDKYFLDDQDAYSDTVLQNEIDLAEAELLEYVAVDSDTITSSIKRHYLNIVKYRGFVRLHGDTEFDHKPQIVKDYEATIKILSDFKNANGSLEGADLAKDSAVSITANTRLFDRWFNDPYGDISGE